MSDKSSPGFDGESTAAVPGEPDAALRAQLQQLIDLLPQLIMVRDRQGRILMANRALAEAYGTSVAVLTGTLQSDWHPAADELRDMLIADRVLDADETCVQREEYFTDASGLRRELRVLRTPCQLFRGSVFVLATDITLENNFRLAQEVARIGYWHWVITTNTLTWSDEIYRVFGLTPQAFGSTYEAFLNSVHPDDRGHVHAAVKETLEQDVPYDIEHRIVRPDGTECIVHEQGRVERDNTGRPVHMLGTVQDITDQKRIDAALAVVAGISLSGNSSDFFRTIVTELGRAYATRYAFVGVFADNARRSIRTLAVVAGDEVMDNFEYELAGTPCADVLDRKIELIYRDAACLYPDDLMLQQMGIESYFGAPLIDSDGRMLGLVAVMDTRPMVMSSWQRPVLGVFASRIASEVERQRTLDELRGTERFLDDIVEHLPMTLFVKEAKGLRFVRINQAGEALFGVNRCELFGKNDYDIFPKEDADFSTRTDRQVLMGDIMVDVPRETLHTRHMGERILHMRKVPLRDEGDRPAYLIGIAEDITEQVEKDNLLQDTLSLQRAILDTANLIIITIDSNGLIQSFNAGAEKMLGYRAGEVIGKVSPMMFHDPEELASRAQILERRLGRSVELSPELFMRAEQDPELKGEWTLIRKDGSRFSVQLAVRPLYDANNQQRGYMGTAYDITDRRQAEQALREILAMQEAILNSANSSIISTDPGGTIRSFNAGAEAMLGYRAEEVIDKVTPVLIHDREEIVARATELSEELGRPIEPGFEAFVAKSRLGGADEREWTYIRKDGGRLPVLLSVTAMRDEQGAIHGFLGIARDLTAKKQAEDELRLAASVFDHSLEGIAIFDAATRMIRVNQAFSDITGYSAEEALGKTPRLLRSDRHPQSFYDRMWASLDRNGMWQGEIWNRRKDGSVYPEWRSIIVIRDEQGKVLRYISIFTDITEKKLSEERIYRLAHYDVITALPNRALFTERLGQALVHADRHYSKLAVLFLDLDGFKLVNDTLGHPLGDQLLQAVAQRLERCVRPGDTVSRLGGDEFTILLTDLAHREDAAAVAEKVLAEIAEPYQLDIHQALISTSIGISTYPGDGQSAGELLKNADAAMYHAKEEGKNTYRFFTVEMNRIASEHLTLRNALLRALDNDEFLLHYQPQVDLRSGRVFGFEALARWQTAEGEMISPARFIPVAEESGLIIQLGYWVLRTACRQIKMWQKAGFADLHVAVNLSRRQFSDPALIGTLQAILTETGLEPRYLELEITETFFMQNAEAAADTLDELHELGIEISIDDFGIAYSSLSQLKHFSIDRLKVDQSFVRDIPSDRDDMAITSAIIAMGHSLNLRVIAEGVETAEQLAFLREQGCDELQGYYFSRPLPAEGCIALLQQRKSLPPA